MDAVVVSTGQHNAPDFGSRYEACDILRLSAVAGGTGEIAGNAGMDQFKRQLAPLKAPFQPYDMEAVARLDRPRSDRSRRHRCKCRLELRNG